MRKRLTAGLCLGVAAAARRPRSPARRRAATCGTRSRATADPRGPAADIKPERFKAFTLDKSRPDGRPGGGAEDRAARGRAEPARSLTLPAPDGGFQRFEVYEAPIMEAGLAAKHPDIKTYAGRGIDDPTASVVADTTSLGFHASVRSPDGALVRRPVLPRRRQRLRQLLHARPRQRRRRHVRRARARSATASRSTSARRRGRGRGPAIQLRTYRLALITDPTLRHLLRRPGQRHRGQGHADEPRQPDLRDESAIRLVLIADNDKLNLNTAALATGANGPCGSAAVLHGGAALVRQRDAGPQPHRDRPDHRRRQLRRRPHRARHPGRRRRQPRRHRRHQQGARLHRPRDAGRRLLRRRLRGARDGPPVRRQPHLQRHAAQLLGRQPQRGAPRSSRARARRSWPTPASATRTTCSRTRTRTGPSAATRRSLALVTGTRAADQRGPERLAARLRRHATRSR